MEREVLSHREARVQDAIFGHGRAARTGEPMKIGVVSHTRSVSMLECLRQAVTGRNAVGGRHHHLEDDDDQGQRDVPEHPGGPLRSRVLPRQALPLVKEAPRRGMSVLHRGQGAGRRRTRRPATYVGMCHIFCFGPHAKEIMGDIPNYTDLTPVLQISEVVVERA